MNPLEGPLRRKRARIASKLIGFTHSHLDLGCGDGCLLNILDAKERVGIDRELTPRYRMDLKLIQQDITEPLPFADNRFMTASMLAVIEHLKPENRESVLREIHRVLIPRGILIITTPHPHSDTILESLARVGLLSRHQIDDHEELLDPSDLEHLLRHNGYAWVKKGSFEAGLNYWMSATKKSDT